jgi:hypothetical protein
MPSFGRGDIQRICSDQAVDGATSENPPPPPLSAASTADLEEQLAALIEFQYVVSQRIAGITAHLHGDQPVIPQQA